MAPRHDALKPSEQSQAALADFLLRHPWSQERLLQQVYGKRRYRLVLEEARQKDALRTLALPGLGKLLADKREPDKSIPALYRWQLVRDFAVGVMGAIVFFEGLSPGPQSDARLYWPRSGSAWLLWADLGGCAPEALGFVRQPPDLLAEDIGKIIVTTQAERIDSIAAQLERAWRHPGRVYVYHAYSGRYRELHLRGVRPRTPGSQPSQADLPGSGEDEVIQDRIAPDRSRNLLGSAVRDFSQQDYRLLIFIGNNPLLSLHEAACSFYRGKDYKKAVARLEEYLNRKLIHAPDPGRYVLTGKGLKILAEFWGTSLEHLARFHPWPQKFNARRQPAYAVRWARRIPEHTTLVRQFALGLEEGARRVSRSYGGAAVEILTMVGARHIFQEALGDRPRYGWVIPDALFEVCVWRRAWVDGAVAGEKRRVVHKKVLLEVDRATNPITRIEERLEKFQKIWPALNNQAVLVWLITGPPSREKRILERMGAYGLDGWTVLYERLVLPANDPWWHMYPVLEAGLGYDAVGGMAPWRAVWHGVHGHTQQEFLGHAPWRRELHLSQAAARRASR